MKKVLLGLSILSCLSTLNAADGRKAKKSEESEILKAFGRSIAPSFCEHTKEPEACKKHFKICKQEWEKFQKTGHGDDWSCVETDYFLDHDPTQNHATDLQIIRNITMKLMISKTPDKKS